MTDLSGITICPGIMSPSEKERLAVSIKRIGAKALQDHVRIDTTHFVCTEGRGQGWERAQEMNIPIVRPEWLDACEQEGRIVGVRNYYLGADIGSRPQRQRPVSQTASQHHPQNYTNTGLTATDRPTMPSSDQNAPPVSSPPASTGSPGVSESLPAALGTDRPIGQANEEDGDQRLQAESTETAQAADVPPQNISNADSIRTEDDAPFTSVSLE